MYESYRWKFVLTGIITVLWGLALYFNKIPYGLDLAGGTEIIYSLDFGGRPATTEGTEDTIRVLRERVDVLGVKELSIRRQGANEVVVQVPAATPTEVERIKMQIERSGQLKFMLLVRPGQTSLSDLDIRSEIARVLQRKKDQVWSENERYDVVEWHAEARGTQGADVPELVENITPGGKKMFVDGSLLADAHRSQDEHGKPAVGFEWNSEGAKLFRDLTGPNKGRNLAVVLDGKIRSAPTIEEEIGRQGIINGGPQGWDEKELNSLIIILKAGALPAKPIFAYRKDVGAQLGQNATTVGGISTLAALAVIMVFMCWYYGFRAGMVANVAMALNIFLLLGTLALFGATLTLPGIAGVVLTGAMALDSNVLIYERIREESERGASLKQAIQAGYDRAFFTFVDTHVTSILTGLVLMWVGTGPIKGFGLSLTVGLVASLYTALVVTQALYGLFVVKGIITGIHFKRAFEGLTFDFWAFFPKAVVISLSTITIGWLVFLARGDEKYGIDFTGGTSLEMVLREPIEKHDVEALIGKHFADKKQEVQVEVQRVGQKQDGGTELSREWLLRTRLVGAPVEAAAPAPVGSAATAEVGSGKPAATATTGTQEFFANEVRAIFAGKLVEPYPKVDGADLVPGEADATGKVRPRFHVNLVGLAASGFEKAEEVTVERVRLELPKVLKALAASDADKNRKELLLGLAGPDAGPAGFSVEPLPSTVQGQASFEFKTHAVPQHQVAAAVDALKMGLERARDHEVHFAPATPLPNVDQIGSVVAKNLKSKAILAATFAFLMICFYIWLRFDLWSGITALVAIVHDVLSLLGFLAILDFILSELGIHYDVKFSLTTITAFLTLIGVTINETIVILDRVREEMHIAKTTDYTVDLVNRSIHRTLSRTVITATMVMLCLSALFVGSFFGLTAIQGFSVALLFGVVTGTYTAIFVTSPLLLCNRQKVYRWLAGIALFLIVTLALSFARG